MANTFGQSPSLTSFLNQLDDIKSQGNYNSPMKLPAPVIPKLPSQGAVGPSAGTALGPGMSRSTSGHVSVQSGTGALDRLMAAIRRQESSNNYRAVNSSSRAAGGYQVMPSNFTQTGSGWDMEALGRDISLNQFMNSPQVQDQIARFKLGQYLQRYGSAAAAAAAWYGGPGAVSHMYDRTPQPGGYPSLYAYMQSVLSKM